MEISNGQRAEVQAGLWRLGDFTMASMAVAIEHVDLSMVKCWFNG
jgi:hypothetical protein